MSISGYFTGPVVLLDPEKMGLTFEMSLWLLYTTVEMYEIFMHFRFMAAVFDLPFIPTSESTRPGFSVCRTPKMWGRLWNLVITMYTSYDIHIVYELPINGGHL